MKNLTKIFLAACLLMVFAFSVHAQSVGINADGSPPNGSAMLDVSSANKGLLIPNVALTGTTNAGPITLPAVSLLVYNTATVSDVTPGYYYNSGTSGSPVWTKLTNAGTNPGDMQYWNGTAWVMVAVGLPGQFLQLTASSIPSWSGATFPTLTTDAATAITETTATSGGNITNNGGSSVTTRGVCWAITHNPTISDSKTTDGTGSGIFTSSLTGLSVGTKYYVRAYATNGIGTAYGEEVSFTTSTKVPTLAATTAASSITATTASSGGNVTSDGGETVIARGVCWSLTTGPIATGSHTTDGGTTGTYTSSLTGLTAGTTYYVRAYATNSVGTAYGSEISFTTSLPASGTVNDIDGNTYNYITIGTQTWMIEDLKTTKYRNGESILNVTVEADWINLASGAYCWYNNNAAYKATYGALYNWYAVVDSRNIAPVGWHVPTDAEFTTLITFLGGESGTGGKLKEAGYSHWQSPNTNATNSSGFTALPTGNRVYNTGFFFGLYQADYWWSTTAEDANKAIFHWVAYSNANSLRASIDKRNGFSVRCVRD